MASLASVEQKIFRGALHLKELTSELEGYFHTNPGKMVMQPNSDPDEPVFSFQPKEPIPARFGLIIGDCLQNFRSALDYLVWELVLANNNQPTKDNMFPICSTRDAFVQQATKRKRLEGVHPDALALIDSLQPYQLGQDWPKAILAVLDELANINKHRRVLLTMLRAGQTDKMPTVEIDGELWVKNPPTTLETDTQFRAKRTAANQMEMEGDVFACVTFDEGAAKGMEISYCLNLWGVYIKDDLVPQFQRFFS